MRLGFGSFGSGSTPGRIDFAALGAAFWLDASHPDCYTASGSMLTSLKSLVSGTPLSTIVGSPQIITDPRDNKPSFYFPRNSADYVLGVDAPYIAAVAGTDRPFCSIAVVNVGDVTFGSAIDSVKNSGNSGNGQEFLASSSNWYLERDGAPSGPARLATSESVLAGCCVVVQRSADGVTVKTSINGGPESTASAFASPGALSPNIVGIGVQTGSSNSFPFYGLIKERVYFGTDRSPSEIAAWVDALMRKWPGCRAPQVHFIGDSLTTAQAATNGGMPALLSQRMRALGAYIDPQGPYATGMPYPYRHSGVSGNTCAQMNTRVLSSTLGLGLGGGSKGSYRRTKLVCLMAGTNGVNATDYNTLLNSIDAQLQQSDQSAKIAVTTIPDLFGSTAAVVAYNDAIRAHWATFESTRPGRLIYWDAFQAVPNDGSTTYYTDGTHFNDAGYVRLMDDPQFGLLQAVRPYLLSIQ